MKTQTTLIKLAVVLAATFVALQHSNAQESTITGELKYLQAANERVFLAIDSTKRVVSKGDDGALVGSKLLQLAIADPELGKKAMGLIGKTVVSQGEPMARHTQHHHTEVLWVVKSIEEVPEGINASTGSEKEKDNGGSEAEKEQSKETLNPHSVEW